MPGTTNVQPVLRSTVITAGSGERNPIVWNLMSFPDPCILTRNVQPVKGISKMFYETREQVPDALQQNQAIL